MQFTALMRTSLNAESILAPLASGDSRDNYDDSQLHGIQKVNNKTITTIGFTIVGALVCSGLYIGRERKVFEERRKDVELLTRLCLGSTNKIETTLELMSLAGRQGIQIVSPIPRDPSQLCYVLMNPYDPSVEHSMPKQILILETNVTDERLAFVSTVDGSVFARSAKAEK